MWFKKSVAQPTLNTSDIFYEIFVRSFYDSNGDGIGDLNGITKKLDYLAELGITGIWITPVNPSPSYHKYDVTNYYDIDPEYGTLSDFKNFIIQAHRRNIKVVMDLVLNHTSVKHPWFLASGKNDPLYKDYYIWSSDTGITSKPNWFIAPQDSPILGTKQEKYFGFFSRGMPDLNFDNPKVRDELIKVGEWWLTNTGIDGFRLDAAQHIYESEKPAKNNEWWLQFTDSLKKIKPDVITIGEIWNRKSLVATYLKPLTGAFNFECSWNILRSLIMEKNDSLIENLLETYKIYSKYSNTYMDPVFLSNHDNNRVQSDLKDNIEKAKLAAAIYLTLPGTPFIYYGEELGMRGRKPDELIREPFLWDDQNQDPGETAWETPVYSIPDNVKPLTSQRDDASSMYNHYKKLLDLRKKINALSSSSLKNITTDSAKFLIYYRGQNKDQVIIIHNLSSSVLTLSLSELSHYPLLLYQSKQIKNKSSARLTLFPYSTVILGQK